MLTKKECMEHLQTLHLYCNTEDREMMNVCVDKLILLINEHFDNPPLKFEELKVGMWVWDNLSKTYIKLKNQFLVYGEWIWQGEKVGCDFISDLYFEENRYFRKQVE